MKLKRLFLSLFALPFALTAAEWTFNADPWDGGDEGEPGVDHFWEATGYFDYVGKSKITTPGYEGQFIHFHQGRVGAGYTGFLGCECDCGLYASIDYANTYIHWKQNPSFNQNNFDNLWFNFGGFSSHFPGWLWKTNIGVRLDLNVGKLANYSMYSLTMWGRYQVYPCFAFHTGIIAVTGLCKDKAWPIIGVDYTWGKALKISLVYPVDISISYQLSPSWSIAVAERFFWTRHRTGEKQPVPRAIVEYRNSGQEGRLTYTYGKSASASIHAGYANGQDLIIGNSLGSQNTHYKFRGAPYAGGDFNFKF